MSEGPCTCCLQLEQEAGALAGDVAQLVRALRLEFHPDPEVRQTAASVTHSASRLNLRALDRRLRAAGR